MLGPPFFFAASAALLAFFCAAIWSYALPSWYTLNLFFPEPHGGHSQSFAKESKSPARYT